MPNIAYGINIHVGGLYINVAPPETLAGSEGCFLLQDTYAGNEGVNAFIDDVLSRNSEKIFFTIEKRKKVSWTWCVDSNGTLSE
jgi:hypothetical protein